MELNLKNPLIFFDLETTGINITKDKIVEISYIKIYPNGKKEWLGEIRLANNCLELLNPYVVYEKGYENEPLEMFDSLDRLKEWCYLQKATSIASGKKPIEYYYNYCYSVEEGGDFI